MDKKDNNTAIIVYTNDDGTKISDFCTILTKDTSTVTFKNNNNNIIELPWFRILKIKYKKYDENKAGKYTDITLSESVNNGDDVNE